MTHIDLIKSKIEEQGWTIQSAEKVGPFYVMTITDGTETKQVRGSIQNDAELEYLQGVL